MVARMTWLTGQERILLDRFYNELSANPAATTTRAVITLPSTGRSTRRST
jgi:hypothetical protein